MHAKATLLHAVESDDGGMDDAHRGLLSSYNGSFDQIEAMYDLSCFKLKDFFASFRNPTPSQETSPLLYEVFVTLCAQK